MHGAVVEQALDQLPQLDGVLLQDARDLALLGVQVADHAGGEEVGALAQRRERRLQLVGDVLQEARLLRFQRDQALAQPVELRAEPHHVARALDADRARELALAETADALGHLGDRARNEEGEGRDQDHRGRQQRDHQPEDVVARLLRLRAQLLDALVDHLVAHLHQRLAALGEGRELARQPPRELRRGPGTRDQLVHAFFLALDGGDLGALVVGKRHRVELARDPEEARAIGAVGLEESRLSGHRVLARRAFQRRDHAQQRAARLRHLHRGMDRLLGEAGEALERERIGKESEEERRRHDRKSDQQQGEERTRIGDAHLTRL